jgi:hypothetical protein
MAGHSFLGIACKLCSKSVDLQADLYADENGKAVHEDCYVKRLSSEHSNSSAAAIEGSEPAA